MQFTFPTIVLDEPNVEELAATFKKKLRRKIAIKILTNIWIRTKLAEAQNWKCCWCGCDATELRNEKHSATIEHVLPKSLGGTDDWYNLAMSCHECNRKRGILPIEDFLKE